MSLTLPSTAHSQKEQSLNFLIAPCVLDCLAVEFFEELCSMQMPMCTLHINIKMNQVQPHRVWLSRSMNANISNFFPTNFAPENLRSQNFHTSEICIWSTNTEDKDQLYMRTQRHWWRLFDLNSQLHYDLEWFKWIHMVRMEEQKKHSFTSL